MRYVQLIIALANSWRHEVLLYRVPARQLCGSRLNVCKLTIEMPTCAMFEGVDLMRAIDMTKRK